MESLLVPDPGSLILRVMIIKISILIILTWVLPICLGLFPVRFMGRARKTPQMLWISGFIFMVAIFQAISVPMIINEFKFTFLSTAYTTIIMILGILCLITGLPVLKEAFSGFFESPEDKKLRFIMIPPLVLILIQLLGFIFFAYPDGDDAFYIGTSLTTLHTDSMYIISPYTGDSSPMDIRHALSPVPVFISWLSQLTGIHVSVLSHVYLGCFMLIMMYSLYYMIGTLLFPGQKRNCWIFLFFINMLFLMGNVSIYTVESFIFTRAWQGKAIFGALLVPLIFYLLLLIFKNEMDIGEWILLFMLSMAGVFTTSTAVFTIPLIIGTAVIIYVSTNRSVGVPSKVLPCLMPCAIYGLLYLILR